MAINLSGRADATLVKAATDAAMANVPMDVSRIHERNDKHSCVKQYKRKLPNLDKLVNQMICIPVGWWLSKEDREYIVSTIKEGW